MESATHPQSPSLGRPRLGEKIRSLPWPRPELAALLLLAVVLDLWALGQNGWANDYYAAAVRSMAGSWHNFLFGSFDPSGLMTVDKPPAAFWVQALSVKAFGFSSAAILVPQALMGAASVGFLYDLTRRRFGRIAGSVAGLCLALTPIAVAISRHNNPDALLVLCCVAAVWAFVRALEDGSTKWLVAAGALVGLGFETKMGVALMVVPGMAAAWLWVAPRGRAVALRQLLAAGAVLGVVALAWPVMVELTPASSRPWISGTNDNSVFSLILEYNGLGRLDGQEGGPGGMGNGGPFGGETGIFRLLNASLGGQAGWLLGFALVGGAGVAVLSRLRRLDPRTGWILAVGGAFATTVIAFSLAGGIFHPYYVSFLAPWIAAIAGATFAQARDAGRAGRIFGALAIGAGAVTEIAVVGSSATELDWLVPVVALAAIGAAFVLLTGAAERHRGLALAAALGVLLIGPAIWSAQTLGHPTSGTFPAGGPESASAMGGPGGMGGGPSGGPGGVSGGGSEGESSEGKRPEGASEMPGPGEMPEGAGLPGMPGAGAAAPEGGSLPEGAMPGMLPPGAESSGPMPGELGALPQLGGSAEGGSGEGASPFAGGSASAGGMFGGQDLSAVLAYTEGHGGGTVAMESQSSASSAIIESGAEVAGIGGFSGKESTVSVAWLREEIADGRIRWILSGGSGPGGGAMPGGTSAEGMPGFGEGAEGMPGFGGETGRGGAEAGPGGEGASAGLPGDSRNGSETAIEEVIGECTEVPTSELESDTATESTTTASAAGTLYDCSPSAGNAKV